MRLIRIDTLDDPRLEQYRDVRDRDLAGHGAPVTWVRHGGRFMAEGELVARRLIEGGRWGVESVLVADNRLAGMQDALGRLPDGTPVYIGSQRVVDGVVGFHIHRGVLAVGVRNVVLPAHELLSGLESRANCTVVCAERMVNHDNMGALFRNAAALSADGVLLTENCCDPLYRKALRVSMGAVLRTPYGTLEGGPARWIGLLRERGFTTVALTPAPDAVDIDGLAGLGAAGLGRVALVLGSEGPGLTDEAMRSADVRARIPMAEGADSLNLATAGAVALFALRAARAAH